MSSASRIHGSSRVSHHHAGPTTAELKHGLARMSESGYEDANPLKGNLPAKIEAGFQKVEPGQDDVTEFYQLRIKGHTIYVGVTGGQPNRLHAFDSSGKVLVSGTFQTDGEPIAWK